MEDNILNLKFETIRQNYLQTGLSGGSAQCRPGLTKKGHFFQSNLDHIKNGMEYLIKNGIILKSSPFFDAGAGDGRVLAITSACFNVPSFGLEYDPMVVEDGIAKMEILKQKKLLSEGIPVVLEQGDFTMDDNYKKLGIKFEDIGTFFNFDNSYNDIADKIFKQSPTGTIFLFMRITQHVLEFKGLEFICQINLSNLEESRYNLTVYKKFN